MNVAYLLVNSANNYPDRTAVISNKKSFSYKSFNERVNRLAFAMSLYGLRKGDRVALMFFNTHHFAEVYFATLKLGAIATPVNFRFVDEEIEYIINDSGCSIFFFAKELQDTIAGVSQRLQSVEHFVGVDAGVRGVSHDYETFLRSGEPEEPEVEIGENDPCQIMYTSGTTGKPKGAVITHGNIFWNLMNTILTREHRAGEISLIIGPLYHTAALNNHFTVQVALGGTSIMIRKFDPEMVLSYIEKERANVISGSPAMFNSLLQHPRLEQFDTRSITKCTAGAAILPQEIKMRLVEVFPKAHGVYDLYGCTEASPTITTLKGEDSFRKPGSVGLPAPFLHARVVDEGGMPLPPNQVGEVVCKGPNVMQGYYKNPEATEEAIKGGWLYTGDLATVDEEGYFYIVDRKKDMIVSGGENIYPREIEEVILRHPAIADVAVVGIPDSTWGETVKAFLVLREGEIVTEKGIIDFCKKHLASYKKPTQVAFISSIPRNPSGKALKRILRSGSQEYQTNSTTSK
ncbi:MAG: long-chain-fatty-acid--CoA ligase [Deltaproteobacteria bacterium]|nr:MAG: long-chain-fatty-acid--CoA ligase [Deltaproteobacteria bacterium]